MPDQVTDLEVLIVVNVDKVLQLLATAFDSLEPWHQNSKYHRNNSH